MAELNQDIAPVAFEPKNVELHGAAGLYPVALKTEKIICPPDVLLMVYAPV